MALRLANRAGQRASVPVADPTRTMSRKAQRRLDAAAAMLQAPRQGAGGWGMVIQVQPGETWHQAVLRVIQGMPKTEQDQLKSLVDWVDDYELAPEPERPARPALTYSGRSQPDSGAQSIDQEFDSLGDDAVEMALLSVEDIRSARPIHG
jgi:hypothetical protein